MFLKKYRIVLIVIERYIVVIFLWLWKYIYLFGWYDRVGKYVVGLNFLLRLFFVVFWVDLIEGESRMEWCLERI